MIERTFSTTGRLRLDLMIPAGSIDVETTDGGETHVELDCDDERALEHARVELRERAGRDEVVVSTEKHGLFGGRIQFSFGGIGITRYRLRVRCPHGSDLLVRTAAADVDARGSFGEGEVHGVSGELRLGDFAGDLVVKSVSGDTEVGHVGGKLAAHVVSGDVRVAAADGPVATKSVSGDLRLVVADGSVALVSVSGDIEVGVKRGSRLYVDANSVSGTLDSEVPLASTSSGDDGGPLVELRARTVSGDFRVVRA